MNRATAGVRVVSLLPSVTETLLAWGVEPVACTRFCEQSDLVHVGGTKDPDLAAIVALEPDLVVMDEEENRWEDAEALADAGLHVFTTAVRSVGDVAPTLAALGARVGVEATTAIRVDRRPITARAFVPIWRNPYMTMNRSTYGSSMLEHLGVENVFGTETVRYPTIELVEAMARDPDVVLAPSEPYPFSERQRPELEAVAPVIFVDGQDLFWWGVRTQTALDRLARQLSV
ncbi:MAG TPA: helical backbone metal receptor [Acidimicrobiales bacterium]|nr:helical backbone metal receptor [Acidimicrobiales bacterium]